MSLAANLDAGERAVREVKRWVHYASANLVSDRAAQHLLDQEHIRQTHLEPQRLAAEKLARQRTSALVTAPVSAKKAFFESLAVPQPKPAATGVGVGQFYTSLADHLSASRGQYDQFGNELVKGDVTQRFEDYVAMGYSSNMETRIWAISDDAKFRHVGNCMELAAIAFTYLYDEGIRPLDYMGFGNTPTYDHAWLVIGRVDGSDLWDIRTWGDDAVWCDPWQLRDGRVYSTEALCRGAVVNLDQAFNLGSAELVNAGQPYSMWRAA